MERIPGRFLLCTICESGGLNINTLGFVVDTERSASLTRIGPSPLFYFSKWGTNPTILLLLVFRSGRALKLGDIKVGYY